MYILHTHTHTHRALTVEANSACEAINLPLLFLSWLKDGHYNIPVRMCAYACVCVRFECFVYEPISFSTISGHVVAIVAR